MKKRLIPIVLFLSPRGLEACPWCPYKSQEMPGSSTIQVLSRGATQRLVKERIERADDALIARLDGIMEDRPPV